MAEVTLYELALRDRISSGMKSISGTSSATASHLMNLKHKQDQLRGTTSDLGGSLLNLRQKMSLLCEEKELIDSSNLPLIKKYNQEIGTLSDKIEELDGVGKKKAGGFKSLFSQINNLAGGLLTNPFAIGMAGIGFAVKGAMSDAENMAKINITAQLNQSDLNDLSRKIKDVTIANKADISIAPVGFEKIISQVNDVESSLSILDAVQKGSKGGFVDMDVAAGALAQTLSIVGKTNTTPIEILDTFFAAKRVGAGEFEDFARYMPTLIAGASNLGIEYKEVAGVFAYMTGKGQSAEKAAVLMENAFSVLGRGEVQKNMSNLGVRIFDTEGKMRGIIDIAKDMNSVLAGKSNKEKSNILESMGLRDKEAKNAFSILLSDTDKLQSSLLEVSSASGETARAIELSANPVQKTQELWNYFKGGLFDLGTKALPLVNLGLDIAGGILSIAMPILSTGVNLVASLFTELMDGNPLLWGLIAAVGVFSAVMSASRISIIATTIATKAKTVWDTIAKVSTAIWTGQQLGLNAAMYACPLTWLALGIGVLVAGIIWAWKEFAWFRETISGCWEVMRQFGSGLIDAVMTPIKKIISGIGSIGKAISLLFSGDFSGAWDSAKNGISEIFSSNPLKVPINAAVNLAAIDYKGALAIGVAKRKTIDAKKKEGKGEETSSLEENGGKSPSLWGMELPITPPVVPIVPGTIPGSENKTNKGSNTSNYASDKVFDLNKITSSKGSSIYNAIAGKLQPVRAAGLTAAAMIGMTAPSLQVSDLNPSTAAVSPATEMVSQSNLSKKAVAVDRICNSLIINVQNSDSKGHEQIRSEITEVLEEILDDYA